jgi:hypothetical protein
MITNGSAGMNSALDRIAQSVARLCDADDAVILRVERDRLRLDSHYGSLSSVKVGEDFPIRPDWVSGQAVSEGKVAHIFDMVAQRSSDFDSAADQGDVH